MIRSSESPKQQVMTGRPGLRPKRQEFVQTDARLGFNTNLGSIACRDLILRPKVTIWQGSHCDEFSHPCQQNVTAHSLDWFSLP
jgi:hypothetical protein